MRIIRKKLMAMLFSFVIAITAIPTMEVEATNAYRALPAMTGDQAVDTAKVAASQVNYNAGTNKDNIYAIEVGGKNKVDWCAYFVTWCTKKAGLSASKYPSSSEYSSVTKTLKWFKDKGRWHRKNGTSWSYNKISDDSSVDSGYVPKTGDLIILETDGYYSSGPDHIGIVESVSGGVVNYIHGNSKNSAGEYIVKRTPYSLSDSRIWGYCNPDYVTKVNNAPIGSIDNCSGDKGAITLTGWTFDPDCQHESLAVHVYVGGPAGSPDAEMHAIRADKYRPDVNSSYGSGDYHGIDATIDVDKVGEQDVYIYAIDIGGTDNTLLGTKRVSIEKGNSAPIGSIDNCSGDKGVVTLTGWTFDSDCQHESLAVHVYVGGPAGSPDAEMHAIRADKYRPDVNSIHGSGDYHGIDATINVDKVGEQDVYIYAIDIGGNENTLLGEKRVRITKDCEIKFPENSVTLKKGESKTIKFTFDDDCIHSIHKIEGSCPGNLSLSWGEVNWRDRYSDATFTITANSEGSGNITIYLKDSSNNTIYEKNLPVAVGHEHEYTTSKITKNPTCTETGVRTYTCSCGATKTETIAKTGHTYSAYWTVDKAATCQTEGSKSHHCLYCSAKTDITTISKTSHTGGTATCAKRAVCSVCGVEYGSLGGHTYSAYWTIDKAATCQTEGSKSHHCLYCSAKTDITTIGKTAHTGGTATCTKRPVCSVCGVEYGNLGGHNYSTNWTIDKAATCQTEGSKSHHCLYCSAKTDITTIGKTAHTGGTATCSKRAVCSICGTEYGELSDHVYSNIYTIDREATTTTEGEQSRHCLYCSARTDIISIPKIDSADIGDIDFGEDEDFSTVDDDENEIPAIGTEFEYKGIMYLITKSSETEGAVRVTGYFGNSKNVVIPNEVEYDDIDFKVTEIGNEAFANTPKLTKITIGKNVMVIGINAFKECPQLKKIIINTKKLKKVGKGAFVDINKKAVIKVPRTKARAYKKILKKKGIAPNVRITS